MFLTWTSLPVEGPRFEQVWDWQGHCRPALGFESWKGVRIWLLKFAFLLILELYFHRMHLFLSRIRDELSNQSAETTNLTNKLDGVSFILLFFLKIKFKKVIYLFASIRSIDLCVVNYFLNRKFTHCGLMLKQQRTTWSNIV